MADTLSVHIHTERVQRVVDDYRQMGFLIVGQQSQGHRYRGSGLSARDEANTHRLGTSTGLK